MPHLQAHISWRCMPPSKYHQAISGCVRIPGWLTRPFVAVLAVACAALLPPQAGASAHAATISGRISLAESAAVYTPHQFRAAVEQGVPHILINRSLDLRGLPVMVGRGARSIRVRHGSCLTRCCAPLHTGLAHGQLPRRVATRCGLGKPAAACICTSCIREADATGSGRMSDAHFVPARLQVWCLHAWMHITRFGLCVDAHPVIVAHTDVGQGECVRMRACTCWHWVERSVVPVCHCMHACGCDLGMEVPPPRGLETTCHMRWYLHTQFCVTCNCIALAHVYGITYDLPACSNEFHSLI